MLNLAQAMSRHGLVRLYETFCEHFKGDPLKDLVADDMGPHREMTVHGREVINFGSDSFLGLDQDKRLQQALHDGIRRWGSHNGASRAFASVEANERAEQKLTEWLGTEDVLIYPSVSLANLGALPGLLGKGDLLAIDEHAHNSMQDGAKIAQSSGVRVVTFSHRDPADLKRVLTNSGKYRIAVAALDGVYSMSGALPPLAELNAVAMEHNTVLYVDDAHGTGVLGKQGRGTVLDALGSYDNTLVIGSLSKAFSCFGGFVGCPRDFKCLLKLRSNTYIFGGPVPPPYLEAICVVCDILCSGEYELIHSRLDRNLRQVAEGVRQLSLTMLGGQTPIISILVGDEEDTFAAGQMLFEHGFYVQSVTFPAVPYHDGVLRIQVNANHTTAAIAGLLDALKEVKSRFKLPEADAVRPAA
jgi:7-keto-8-aminopelargonate synthetase-like enzyme